MASTSSTIRVIFDGTVDGLVRAARKAKAELDGLDKQSKKIDKLGDAFAKIGKGAVGITALTGGAQTAAAAVATLVNLTPGLLLVPGAIAELGAVAVVAKLGLKGFGDAVKSGDLSALAPSARESAAALRGLSTEAHAVQQSVQGALFKGLSTEITKLGKTDLPILQTGLTGIARELNPLGIELAKALRAPDTADDLDAILTNTATSLKGIGPAAGNVAQGFLKLAAFGTRYFGGLGDGLTSLTDKFRIFASNGVESGSFNAALDRTGKTLQQLGFVAGNVGSILGSVLKGLSSGAADGPLDSLLKLTAALKNFFATAQAQEALRQLGDTFRTVADVTRTVLLEALKQVTPVLIAIGPAARTFAEAFGNTLVSVLKIAGPALTVIAEALSGMPGVTSAAAVAFVGYTLALKGAAVLAGPLSALKAQIIALGVATRTMTSLNGRLGAFGSGLVAIGAIVGLGVVAVELDKINVAAANGDPGKLDDLSDTLHNLVGAGQQLASGDIGGIFADIADEWAQLGRSFETGESPIGRFFGNLTRQINEVSLTPITLNVQTNDKDVRGSIAKLLSEVNDASGTININGNNNKAGFALQEIIREINSGQGSVIIDGKPMPAQDALKYVIGVINNGSGEVTINGQSRPAGEVLAELLGRTNSAVGVIQIDGNPVPGTNKITQVVTTANGSTGTITLDGNRVPADGKIQGVITLADGSTGTITIDGNQTPANGKINATVTYANGQTGTIKVDAATGAAQGAIDSFISTNNGRTVTIFVSTLGSGGIASAGRLATGGPVFGPGTGTSDTAGLFALSNGEHVFTAREVKNAGGHMAIARLRAALAAGQIPRLAGGGAIPPSVLTPLQAVGAGTTGSGDVSVRVFIGDTELKGMVRAEIDTRDRATRRTVLAGSGTTY